MKKQLWNKFIAMFMAIIVVLTTVHVAYALQITFNPSLVNVTENSAFIEWQTDEPANSTLFYWSTIDNKTVTLSAANFTLNHSYLITSLNASTQYKYWFASSSQNETVVMNNSDNFYDFTTINITPLALFINATIPQYYYKTRLTINGTTVPNALVHAYANPEPNEIGLSLYDRETFADDNGNFVIYELPLDSSVKQNTVVLWAMDSSGNTKIMSGDVELDLIPPNMTVNIPTTTRTGSINITGTTDENVSVEIYVGAYANDTAPMINETNLVVNQTVIVASIANFSFNIAMPGEKNLVIFNARDIGGNLVTEQATVISDTIPPSFEEPLSLEKFSPTYTLDVEIKGKLSEPGKIKAIVNGKEQDTVETDANGRFTITVALQKAVVRVMNASHYEATYGSFINQTYVDTYPNYVTLVGIDNVGNRVNLTGTITYTPCGFGTWWSVNDGKNAQDYIMPSILSPQMLLDGNAQISYSYILRWQGYGNYTYVISDVKQAPLSQLAQENYDEEWMAGDPMTTVSTDGKAGYAVVKLMAPEMPGWQNLTYWQKLKKISEHRMSKKGEGSKITTSGEYVPSSECTVPNTGCLKLPLILEIQFESADYNGTQKVCNFVEVAIDNSLFSMDNIPSSYLKKMIEFMDTMINAIDPVEKLMKETERVLLYLFTASLIAYFFYKAVELFQCRFSAAVSGFKLDDAMQGCPEKTSAANSQQQGKESYNKAACESCAKALQEEMKFVEMQNWIGDRLFMPSVPTLQKYVKDKWSKDKYSWCYGKGFSASTFPDLVVDDYIDIARNAKTIKGDADNKCPYLHPVVKSKEELLRCCGIEYNRQWRSGCALLDPLEESACEADQAQYAVTGNKKIKQGDLDTKIKCHPAWNAVAGFCDPQGGYVPGLVNTNLVWKDEFIESVADTRKVFFLVVPQLGTEREIWTRGAELAGKFSISIGYIGVEAKIEGAVEERKNKDLSKYGVSKDIGKQMTDWAAGQPYPVQTGTVYYPYYIDEWPFDASIDCMRCLGEAKLLPQCKGFKDFSDKIKSLKDAILWPSAFSEDSKEKEICRIYNEIRSKMGVTDKEYIIDPSQPNLFRSLQCIAIPSIRSHLQHWREVFKILRQCFEITMTTGDSNPTVCREALSIYICDAIYEALKCFTNKYSLGTGGNRGFFSTIGNVIGALTSAGAGVANDLSARYGSDSLFQSIFSEQRLVNAICIFAFTGEWIFDINALLDQEYLIPINSTVLVTPAERRFVSANPLSTPSGFATYNYKIGLAMVAGSDLTYDVQLICSNDYSCSPIDGYEGGKCDCVDAHGGQPDYRHFPLTVSPSLKAGESLGEGGRGVVQYFQFEAPYRYDKVKVSWRWKTAPTSDVREDSIIVPIREVGGKPPAICKFRWDWKMFLCDLGFEQAYAILQEANPVKSIFCPNEKVQIGATVLQQIPKEAESVCQQPCNYTVFLDVTLTRQNGEQIWRSWKQVPINTQQIPEILQVPNDFTLRQEMIRGESVATNQWEKKTFGVNELPIESLSMDMISAANYLIYYNKKDSSNEEIIACPITDEEYQQGRLVQSVSKKNCVNNLKPNMDIVLPNGVRIRFPALETNKMTSCDKSGINVMEGMEIKTEKLCEQGWVAAVMLRFVTTTGAGVTEEKWNWDAKLLMIDSRTGPDGYQVINNQPSTQIAVSMGVPQRKTGTLTVRSVCPGAEGQAPQAIGGEAPGVLPPSQAPIPTAPPPKADIVIFKMSDCGGCHNLLGKIKDKTEPNLSLNADGDLKKTPYIGKYAGYDLIITDLPENKNLQIDNKKYDFKNNKIPTEAPTVIVFLNGEYAYELDPNKPDSWAGIVDLLVKGGDADCIDKKEGTGPCAGKGECSPKSGYCICDANKRCVSKCSYCASGGKKLGCGIVKEGWSCQAVKQCTPPNCATTFCPGSNYCAAPQVAPTPTAAPPTTPSPAPQPSPTAPETQPPAQPSAPKTLKDYLSTDAGTVKIGGKNYGFSTATPITVDSKTYQTKKLSETVGVDPDFKYNTIYISGNTLIFFLIEQPPGYSVPLPTPVGYSTDGGVTKVKYPPIDTMNQEEEKSDGWKICNKINAGKCFDTSSFKPSESYIENVVLESNQKNILIYIKNTPEVYYHQNWDNKKDSLIGSVGSSGVDFLAIYSIPPILKDCNNNCIVFFSTKKSVSELNYEFRCKTSNKINWECSKFLQKK